MKNKPVNVKIVPLAWEEVRKRPVLMFQTIKGPLMGHVEIVSNARRDTVRVYAPAMVSYVSTTNIVFLPVAFVEHHLDLFPQNTIGTNSVPELVAQGYAGYFENFIKGGYAMQPMVMGAKIDGPEASVEFPQKTAPKVTTNDDDDDAEACPACGETVADWIDHYPVYINNKWECEKSSPGLRGMYPNYDPPHPSTVS